MRPILLILIFFSLTIIYAQTPSLNAPILALNTVEQDAIVLYDVNSESYRTLNFGLERHHVWGFSPDGCRLLFTLGEQSGLAKAYTSDLQGDNLQQLVFYDELLDDNWGVWEPQWSPDGERIAFTMQREETKIDGTVERDNHIAWVPAEGGIPEFYSVTGREFEPQWSPDGQWLAYISYEDRAAGIDPFSTAIPTIEPPPGQTPPAPILVSETDLWVVSNDGETKYRLTSFPIGSVTKPRWSPDSELVAFVYSPSGNNDTFWIIGNQQGALPTQLNFDWVLILDLTWLPDGTQILGSARSFQQIEENRLWQIPLVGNADQVGALYQQNLPLFNADYPRFSPDENYLATRTAYDLGLVDLRDGQLRVLSPEVFGNTPPVWSPIGFSGEAACD